MSQFPITSDQGIYEAINYLASGPAGLGQNFSGFSSYQPAYIIGNFREPFTIATTATTNPPSWYISPKGVSTATAINVIDGKSRNIEWTFATPYAQPPFQVGQNIYGKGFSPSFFNGDDGRVLTCSTTSVITQFSSLYVIPALTTSTGSLYFDNSDTLSSTDASARVTINGPTEQVFISSQCQWYSQATATTSSQFDLVVQINRYNGVVDTAPGAVDYLFDFDETVSQVIHRYDISTSTNTSITVDAGQNIFTTVIDQPSYGYYWYIAEVEFVTKPTYRYDSIGNVITATFYDASVASGNSAGVEDYYSTLTAITVTGSGVGATVDVDITNTSTTYVRSAVVYNNTATVGTGYAVGDTLKVLGTDLGGTSPANDLYMTVSQIKYAGDALPGTQTVGLRSLTAQVIKQ